MRIEVRGAINKSWEGTDAQATKFLKELSELQLKKVSEAAGEVAVKKHLTESKRHGKLGMAPPRAPQNFDAFPLTIKIN